MQVKFFPFFPVDIAVVPSAATSRRYFQAAVCCFAALVLAGCQPSGEVSDATETREFTPQLPNVPDSTDRFEPPVMLMAGEAPIAVESPGYACPTVSDVDGDGVDDLVVGQFAGGKLKWYRNTANETSVPDYAAGQWIQCNDQPALVPGVS